MLAAAIIVFREVLEAALVISVVMAATRGIALRGRWVSIGLLGGLLGAGVVATFATVISDAFQGTGQEIINAVILFTAVALIAWHVIWMNSHGRQMAAELKATAKQVVSGEKHLSVLALIVGLAVMREGSEVVLMLQGLWAGNEQRAAMMLGGAIGVVLGVGVGALLYAGFITLSLSRLFALTNGLLVLIAAGMAARGASFLAQADLLPILHANMWDTSFILTNNSIPGKILGALIGYVAQPSGIEVLFYGLTVLSVFALIRITQMQQTARSN